MSANWDSRNSDPLQPNEASGPGESQRAKPVIGKNLKAGEKEATNVEESHKKGKEEMVEEIEKKDKPKANFEKDHRREKEEGARRSDSEPSSLQVYKDGVLVYRYGVPQRYTPGGIRPNPGDQRVDKDGNRYKQTCRKGHYTMDPYPENLTKDKD